MAAAAAIAAAGTVTLFGPRTFTRTTGAPITERVTFQAPAGTFQLHVELSSNWYADDGGVSSAVITLNGVTILSPNDFRPGITTIDRTVTLRASNQLTVEVRGKPGSSLTLAFVGNDSTPPVIKAVAAPAPNAAGWNNTNVTVTFTCADDLAGVATCPSPVVVSTEGAGQVITGEAVDTVGNRATASVTLNIDKTAPVIVPAPSPAPNADGWNNGDVTVNFACSDVLSGVGQCSAPVTLPATGSANGTATDRAGNVATASLQVNIDRAAPAIAARLSAPANSAGWYNAPVTVTFDCSDGESGVAVCPAPVTVSGEGAAQAVKGIARDKAGNSAETSVSVSVDLTPPRVTVTPSASPNAAGWYQGDVTLTFVCEDALSGVIDCPAPRTISQDGLQTVTVTATDRAGLTASSSTDVRIDRTLPAITATVAPAPNAAGWHNVPPVVTFTCTDADSGVAACPAPVTLATSGAGQVVAGTVTDRAGNSATTQVTLNVDLVAPSITAAASTSGATNGNVTVTFTCADDLSGISVCPDPVTITQEGIDQPIEGVAVDKAGNTARATASVSIDRTKPTIVATASPAPNANGWQSAPSVVVTFTCADTGSGIVACPDPVTVSAEGAAQHVTGSVTDRAGNTASATLDVSLDHTPPSITATPSVSGWTNASVIVHFTCADALSGVDHCTDDIDVANDGAHDVTGTAVDKAGNTATASLTVQIDRTPPTIVAAPDRAPNAAGWYTGPVTVTFTCADAGSGIASCTPPAAASAEGVSSVSGTATDRAGNSSSTALTVRVDSVAPTIRAVTAPGWSSGDVVVTFECADEGGSGVASCPAQVTVTAEGTSTIDGEAVDVAGNRAHVQATVQVDRTPPTIVVRAARAPNANGWYNAPVRVEFVCEDTGSSIATCPAPVDVTADVTARIVSGTAVDAAGNTASASITISLDTTPPTIAPRLNPAGAWAAGPVTVSFDCADSGSGVTGCTTPVTVSADGNQVVNGTAADLAGNTASTSATVQIDRAPPEIHAVVTPAAGPGGWYGGSVTVTFQCSDAASGIASCPDAIAVATEGTGQVFTGTARDNAGNTATASATLNVDRTPPALSITSPGAGAVVRDASTPISGTVSDALSGVASVTCGGTAAAVTGSTFACSATLVNGANTVAVDAADAAGNVAHATLQLTLNGNSAPVANAGGPYSGETGAAVTFDAGLSSDAEGQALTYAWTFGDGGTATGVRPSHTFANPGSFAVELVVTDSQGASSSASSTVIVTRANRAPVANAGGPYAGDATQSITFNGSSSTDPDGDPLTYSWNFGDGSTATGAVVRRAYQTAGTYTARLTVDDGRGGSNSTTVQVTVRALNQKPAAQVGGPYSGQAGQAVSFSGSGTDPDNDPLTFAWAFSDGGSSSSAQTTHVFATAGTYVATLTVSDGRGGSAAASAQVIVSAVNTAPVARIDAPASAEAGTSVAFSGATSTDAENDALTYAWSFGDGRSATGASPSHAFATAGPYVVTLTVTDARGASGSATASIEISPAPAQNRPPIVSANGPYSGEANLPVAFSSAGTSDPDKDPLTFAWDFGDGAQGTGASPSHAYSAAGNYTVTLTVADGRGGSASSTAGVAVAPPVDRVPPVVSLAGPRSVLPGTQATVRAQASDNAGVTSVVFEVSGEAGTPIPQPPFERVVSIPAVAAPGTTIPVRVIARDAAGNTATAEIALTITAQPDNQNPVVALHAPSSATPGGTIHLTADATDNDVVDSVTFLVNNVPLAVVQQAPYEAIYVVPADAIPGGAIVAAARAADHTGNQVSTTATIAIADTPDTTPPVVHITAPAAAARGEAITFTADATDANGVAAVVFTLDGARIATVTSAPFQATFVVPATAVDGLVLHVEARAVDFAGLESVDAGQTQVSAAPAPAGAFVLGEVYDDSTGLPLSGATITVAGATGAPVVSDDHGRFAVAAGTGAMSLVIGRDGFTSAYRSVAAGAGVRELVDARLTPRSTTVVDLGPVLGGTVQSGTTRLVVPPGGVSATTSASLTLVGTQGLAGLLPQGWSPVAVIDVAPAAAVFGVPATLQTPRPAGVPDSAVLTLAQWDTQAGAWRAVATASAGAASLDAPIASGGQFAWIRADVIPAAPPQPSIGGLVEGVAAVDVPGAATTAITPQPKVIFYQPGVHSTVQGVVTSPAPLPSGTRLWVRVSESYQFYSGAAIYPDSTTQDLFFYQSTPDGTGLAASFMATPSQVFEALTLDHGVIGLDLYVPADAGQPAAVIPASGGSVSLSSGERLDFPSGAANQPIAASLRTLGVGDLGMPLPADVAFISALDVTLAGPAVTRPGVLSIARPQDLAADAQVIVARVATIQGRTRLVLTAVGRTDGDRLVGDPLLPLNQLEMEGVRTSGRYVFLRALTPIGFAAGHVLTPSGAAATGALVSSETFSVVALSRAGAGEYVAPAGTGSVTLTAINVQNADRGTAAVTLPGPGAEAAADLRLVAEAPRVISATPANNANSVALSTAIVAVFSEPIDPSTVSGANAGNATLIGGTASIAGTVALTGANTVLTYRPAVALDPNTTYTFTLTGSIADAGGQPMGAPFVLTFTTLDTTAPPPPPAGSLNATIPQDGTTTVTGTQGTAGQHDTVTVENVTRGTSTPVLLDPNGGFLVRVQAAVSDALKLKIVDQAGNETVVDLPTFTRANPDGSVSGVVGSNGGHVAGPAGTAVDVPKGSLPDGTVVTIKPVGAEAMPDVFTPEQAQAFPFAGGIQLDFGGATPAKYVNVSIPPKPGDQPGDQWIVAQVMQVAGRSVFNTVDTAKLIDGQVRTSSPPCPGVLAAGIYGVYKSTQPVGLAFGRMYSNGSYDGLQFSIGLATTSVAIPIMFPVYAWQDPMPICLPVLSGHVTVGPNTTRIWLKPGALQADDRQIIVKNVTNSGAESHFRRDVLEYTFEVAGKETDSYSATVITAGGLATPVTSVDVRPGPAGKVVIGLDPDTISVAVAKVQIRNLTAVPVTTTEFPVADFGMELSAAGGLSDFYWVTAVDSNGVSRQIPSSLYDKRAGVYGPGTMVAKAVRATIDPSFDELVASGTPSPVKWRTKVELIAVHPVTKQEQWRIEIPADRIVYGGFNYGFDGESFWDYAVDVTYNTGERDTVLIPRLRLVVQNAQTGTVLKTLEVQAPPKDEPLGVGVITDDTQPPLLTGSPVKMNSFDPAVPLTFTFSEAMSADSVRQNAIVEHVVSGVRTKVQGTWRIYGNNRTATFVPDAPLRMGEEYSVTFIGADSLGGSLSPGSQPVTDLGGNAIATTRLQIRTFAPRLVTSVSVGQDGAPLDEPYDVVVRRTQESGVEKTYLFATTNAFETGAKVLLFDATNAETTTAVGAGYGGRIQRQLTLVPDLGKNGNQPLTYRKPLLVGTCGGPGTSYTGDIAVSVGYNIDDSFVQAWLPRAPAVDASGNPTIQPCLLTSKLLTANPDTLNSYTQPGTVHQTGFAEGVATIITSQGVEAYTAIRDVGLFATDIGSQVPEPFPQDRAKDAFVAGDYYDVVAFQDRLLAANNDGRSLDVYDPNLAQVGTVALSGGARHIVVAENYGVDEDGDGFIRPNEVRNLAFVATRDCPSTTCRYGIDIVDLKNFSDPVVIGNIPMPGFLFGLDIDTAKGRLFATGYTDALQGAQGLFMIDISQPTAVGTDLDHDGLDDRIVWKKAFTGADVSGINRVRIDKERGLAYVPLASALNSRKGRLEVWAIYDNCCDLAADFTSAASTKKAGNRDSLLNQERNALRAGIAKGLAAAAAKCGAPIAAVTLLEQGSGACLWRGQCDDNYQPGLSDHDYEVFVPESAWDTPLPDGRNQATCAASELNAVFTDPVTSEPKAVSLSNGDTMSFEDITFFPEVRERFENATFDVEGPSSSGTDAVGDMGLGRRALLLKWLLEGSYVTQVPGYTVEGRSLDAILGDLKNVTRIPRLEGYEWSVLQDFALAKSKAYLRVAGASKADSVFHDLFVKQLHDAGKAGIRATMARLVSNAAANAMVLDVTRQAYDTNACYEVSTAVTNPANWPEKACTSFEEYVASAAARSLRNNLGVFTYDEVVNQAHRFFRVKSDRERIVSEHAADSFIALVSRFVAGSRAYTQPIYNQTLAADPDAALRTTNMGTATAALAAALSETKLQVTPHVFSRGFRNGTDLRVALYKTDAPNSGTLDKEVRVSLNGGEDRYLEFVHDANGQLALLNGKAQPVFQIKADVTTGFSQPHGVSVVIDLPDRTMKESNRQNNVGGFFYYVLDRATGNTPTVPSAPYFPLADNGLLDPSPECYESPALLTTQFVQASGQNLGDEAILGRGEGVTITLTVQNTTAQTIAGVVACSNITNQCYAMGDLAAGQSATKTIQYSTPDQDMYIDGTPSAYSPASGVITGASLRLIVNGNAYTIQPQMDEAEVKAVDPSLLQIQLGGTILRHYKIVGRRSGQPKTNVKVTAEMSGIFGATDGVRTLTFRTNWYGDICTTAGAVPCSGVIGADDRGLQIPIDPAMHTGLSYRVKLTQVDGQPIAPENATEFTFDVVDRDQSQVYSVGTAIEGTLLNVTGSAEDGMELSKSSKYEHGPQTLGLSLSKQKGVTGKVEFSLFPDIKGGVVIGELKIDGKFGTTESKTPASEGEEYEFPYVPNADTSTGAPPFILDQASQCAIAEVTLQHFYTKSPLVSKVLDLLRESPCNTDLSKYLSGTSKEASWSSTDNVSIGLSIKSALTSGAESKLGVKIGADAGASAGFTTKHSLSYELDAATNTRKLKSETQGYSMFGKVNFGAGLTASYKPDDVSDDDDKIEVKHFENSLKTSWSSTTTDSYGVSFEYPIGQTTPSSMKITYSGPKTFGWKGNIGGEGAGAVTVAPGTPTRSLAYKFSRPEDIQRAVDALANIKAIENVVTQQELAALELNFTPTVLNVELGKFRGLLGKSITPFTETESRGTGKEMPFGLEGKWLGLGIGASITGKLEAKTSYPAVIGVNYKGRTLPLQKYTKDSYLPSEDLSLGDFVGHVWRAVSDSFDPQFSHVGATVTPGGAPQTLRSTMTATLTLDPTGETDPFDAALYSYHYRSIPGPVREGVMLPSDAAGPAGMPHYGIGGFHNFSPDGRLLATPVPLVIDYKDEEVESFDESTFAIYGWNSDTLDWEYVGGVVNQGANTVTATVNRLRLYTIAPRMPARTIDLTATDEGQSGADDTARRRFRITSGPLVNNDGTPIPDGTLYTVRSLVNGSNVTTDYGTIFGTDADPSRDNMQIAVVNGHLDFEVEYPSPSGFYIPGRVVTYSTTGTAFGATVLSGGKQ